MPTFEVSETTVFFDGVSQWAGVPLNTDGDDMPRATYSIWMKLPKAIPAASNGWVMSQYPDHGWSRAVTLNDARLSATAGVSITVGGAWKSTLGKPPVNQWFHVVGTWEQGGTSCVYLNGKKGLCHAQTSNGHDGVASHETLIIGGRGHDDAVHNPSVLINDVRVYKTVLSEANVKTLFAAGRDLPGLQAVAGPQVKGPNHGWSAYAKCPTGYVVTGIAKLDLLDQASTAKMEVDDFQCDSRGCRAYCVGTECNIQAMCLRGEGMDKITVAAGPLTLSSKNQWGNWSTCPIGSHVLGLARVDLLDQSGGVESQDVNDFECTDQGCRVWCTGSDCHVQAMCGTMSGLSVVNGPLVRSTKNKFTSPTAKCPKGYTAISLARVNLRDSVGTAAQDVNDFRCSGDMCMAWCVGSDCDVQARCARVFGFANGGFEAEYGLTGYHYQAPSSWRTSGGVVIVQNGNKPWGGLSSGSGKFFLSLQGAGSYIEQTIAELATGSTYEIKFMASERPGYGTDERFDITVDGAVVWQNRHPASKFFEYRAVFVASSSTGAVVVRITNRSPGGDRSVFVDNFRLNLVDSDLDARLSTVVKGLKNTWSPYAACPVDYKVAGLGRIDLRDQASVAQMEVDAFECNSRGCRALCLNTDCNIQSMCIKGYGLAVSSGPRVNITKNTYTKYATCPQGSVVLGLAKLDLLDESSVQKQDVSSFMCDDKGCRAYCAGSACEVQARCGKASGLKAINSARTLNKKDSWGSVAKCPCAEAPRSPCS